MKAQWHPIETAPKDSIAILLWPYFPYNDWKGRAPKEVVLGYYTDDEEWYNPEQLETFKPTHWMPLPAPPHEGDKE